MAKVKRAQQIKEEVRKEEKYITIEPSIKANKNYFPHLKLVFFYF